MKIPLQNTYVLLGAVVLCSFGMFASSGYGQTVEPVRQTLRSGGPDETGDELVEYADDSDEAAQQTRAERSEALKRRAGEQDRDSAPGRTLLLGMGIQEGNNNRLKVVEVGASSPAFDAGIKKGDEIISFDGFEADSYRKWIDGIRKLVNDAPERDAMPVEVLRDGKVMDLRIRKPVAKADDPRLPMPQTLNQQDTQQLQPPLLPGQIPPGQQPLRGGDNNVMVADFFGGQFGDRLGGTTNRAVAEIFRLNGSDQPIASPANANANAAQSGDPALSAASPAGNPIRREQTGTAPNTNAAGLANSGSGGMQIGLAGFRDTQNGMLVMLDIGGLTPGNYLVGIDQAGALGVNGTANAPIADPSITNGTQRPLPNQNQPVAPQINQNQQTLPGANEQANVATGSDIGSDAPGQVQINTPATGRAGPLATPPTGENPSVGLNAQNNAAGTGTTSGGAGGPAITVGSLTVDQSGTGRMQQTVEGVQVSNVLGQSIVIYSQDVPPQTALPPSLNVGNAPLDPQGAARQPTNGAGATPAGQDRAVAQPPAANQTARENPLHNQPLSGGRQGAVAAGTIRQLSDHVPLETDAGQPAAGRQPLGEGLR